jgi:hypothetical protein
MHIYINVISYFILVLSKTIFMKTLCTNKFLKKNMFIHLREGLREIIEIILTLSDEKNNEIKIKRCCCISSI